jgi:hypothetical protein
MIITAQIVMLIILSPKKCELCKKSKTPKLHIYLGISQSQNAWDVILNY